MDGSTPAPLAFASEVGTRLRGAVSKNELLTVYMITFYLGLYSIFALLVGMASSYGAMVGSFVSAGLGGFGGDQAIMAGIGGMLSSLLGVYGLASARGLFSHQAWARKSAIVAAIVWALMEFVVIFGADKISGPILLLTLLRSGIWVAIAACLRLPSVKNTLGEE